MPVLDALEFDDRREAIAAAIDAARVGDIVLVAGKGHEQGQIIGDTICPLMMSLSLPSISVWRHAHDPACFVDR